MDLQRISNESREKHDQKHPPPSRTKRSHDAQNEGTTLEKLDMLDPTREASKRSVSTRCCKSVSPQDNMHAVGRRRGNEGGTSSTGEEEKKMLYSFVVVVLQQQQ